MPEKDISWPQEDPPSLKLRRDKQLMSENDPSSLWRVTPDRQVQIVWLIGLVFVNLSQGQGKILNMK
jgi:hypothetical protein